MPKLSYQQVYSWTNKYLTSGVDALQDRRGKRKSEDEMSEVEKLGLRISCYRLRTEGSR
ncbi:helix-turn-helix domain-containing protein [Paenibacillus larvae]|uniref:helix-turn-helix domain-containing protein n=1 Tax=Paenibacillus larvae TaxID=1464 RepID=UPI0037CC61EA